MVVLIIVALGIHVHDHAGESGHGVKHRVPGALGDGMGLAEGEVPVSSKQHIGVHAVTGPARPDSRDGVHAFGAQGRGMSLLYDHWLHGIH